MPLPDVVSGLLLSEGSDVRIVSGTLESIKNIGFFNAFLFLSNEGKTEMELRVLQYFLVDAREEIITKA